MKVDQARRFKELEKENARLKRAVANLTVDKLILEEATKGNFCPERRRRCVMHVRQRLGASRHACHVLGQPRSTQRRVKKLPGDEEALRTDGYGWRAGSAGTGIARSLVSRAGGQ